jgi:hypothetical protein
VVSALVSKAAAGRDSPPGVARLAALLGRPPAAAGAWGAWGGGGDSLDLNELVASVFAAGAAGFALIHFLLSLDFPVILWILPSATKSSAFSHPRGFFR